jgi:hypothetical protein
MNPLRCPHCHLLHVDHINMDDTSTPQHGDYSLCIQCGRFSVFDFNEGGLRLPTETEANAIRRNPEARRYRAAWRDIRHH